MGLKSFFNRLGGKSQDGDQSRQKAHREGDPVDYQGFTITPAPQAADSQFRVAGSITAAPDAANGEAGEARVHNFIRADLASSWEDACTMSVDKAKRIIDERGAAMFDQ